MCEANNTPVKQFLSDPFITEWTHLKFLASWEILSQFEGGVLTPWLATKMIKERHLYHSVNVDTRLYLSEPCLPHILVDIPLREHPCCPWRAVYIYIL